MPSLCLVFLEAVSPGAPSSELVLHSSWNVINTLWRVGMEGTNRVPGLWECVVCMSCA